MFSRFIKIMYVIRHSSYSLSGSQAGPGRLGGVSFREGKSDETNDDCSIAHTLNTSSRAAEFHQKVSQLQLLTRRAQDTS